MALTTTLAQRQKAIQDFTQQLSDVRSRAIQRGSQSRMDQELLAKSPTTLKSFIEDIAADAQANPDNLVYRLHQDTITILLAEAEATSAYVQALIDAANSVKPL